MSNTIRETRMSKGMTQTELARLVNISRPYLVDIEKGNSNPSTSIAISIAKALDTTVESIFLPELSYKNNKGKRISV
ncbi:helix-turn-helix transcriptional regulator [Enterococcus devriesei]|uniref:helix-turn-helix transcriptional regulator n=1 Tax=Enterococcus devriesei TaxID=319970 RepID=UPI0028F0C4B4|nr:helix-turn-helix transcriptional regulator [Enterococcus devriesei]